MDKKINDAIADTLLQEIATLKDQLHGETNLAKYYALQERLRAAVKKLNQILNN